MQRRRKSNFASILRYLSLFFTFSIFYHNSYSAETLTLPQVLGLLDIHNPSLAHAKARQELAEAAWVTSRAYPNPELEIGGGGASGLGQGALSGTSEQAFISQPLDLPFVREARRKVAEAGISSAEAANRYVWLTVRSQTRLAFYEILRRQAELEISQDNEKLLTQIRDKIRLKVEVGEAPRYELVKAEAEALNALKLRESAETQVQDAKSALRMMFGPAVPYHFQARGELPPPPEALPDLDSLREEVLGKQPVMHQVNAEIEKAQAKVDYEKKRRYPVPTVKAGVEEDPGLKQWQVYVVVPLPIWNQRQGPIAEALAKLRQAEAAARQQEFAIIRQLENAYNRYRIAHRQVETFETGLLKDAEAALKVAEAAYRLGERGIIDYLDAQRTYRSVRNDYTSARFERQAALIDLNRLRATDLEDL